MHALPAAPVVHVDTDPGWRGGQSLLCRLAMGLAEQGGPVVVACPPEGRLYQTLRGVLPCVPIPAGRSWRTPARLRALGPRMLVAHTSHAHGLCLLLPEIPLVVHRWVDAPPARSPWSRWKYGRVDRFVACSQAVAGVLARAGVPEERVDVVFGGVDPPGADVVPASDAPDVLAIGARVAHKGHDVLAEATRLLRAQGHPLDVAVAGTGPDQFEGLRYLGHRDDIPALLAGARVLAHPSRTEGLGMAVVEAMMAGVPVVASQVGGIPEIVQSEGELVPPGDAPALARGILRALSADPARVGRGRDRVRQQFSIQQMVDGARSAYAAAMGLSMWPEVG